MGTVGVVAGVAAGIALWRVAGSVFQQVQLPGPVPTLVAAGILLIAAIAASLLPAARAARVDVMQALRAE
jgi:ABC-type antimicrobial peptide transport system permease subunit